LREEFATYFHVTIYRGHVIKTPNNRHLIVAAIYHSD